ncbi:MAG: methylenetetrahydrofolate--tRNA-(uracil(54)-C(5))-methyltransferase (FADH(2)-oxidizing) TrmFO, partial [Erysipelotrichaceae bacterium]|nr:methylenetetrahydrofolate--tRNA-(uracil(54)-C(5))-methyltransferase (FADH(2)-oxidizing) TrmFO [Erysipelotrichaceae bacterium]
MRVIGAGLAGSEAAYQLAKRGFEVELYEQKGIKRHPAFKTDDFGELICSNSLRSDDLYNAVGLLKEEMRILHSLIMEAADRFRIPAGKSLAVDRQGFSSYITQKIKENEKIRVIQEEVTQIDESIPTIIAAGPLCEGKLAQELSRLCGNDFLHFYDAVSPIVEKDSIDFNHAYYKSRYDDENPGDYINCPLNKEEFQ